MEIEKKLIRNFLTKKHNDYGVVTAVFMLALCVIMSLFYWDDSYVFSTLLSANKENVFVDGEYWRLLTTTLIHGDLKHLSANSMMLFILTYFVTSFYGAKISLVLSLFMSMVTNAFVISQYAGNTTLVGASGVVYYLWGFWLVLYVFIQSHQKLSHRILRVGAVFFILLIPNSYDPSTSYLAHYFGFLVGMICGGVYYLFQKNYLNSFQFWEYKVIYLDEDDFNPEQLQ